MNGGREREFLGVDARGATCGTVAAFLISGAPCSHPPARILSSNEAFEVIDPIFQCKGSAGITEGAIRITEVRISEGNNYADMRNTIKEGSTKPIWYLGLQGSCSLKEI